MTQKDITQVYRDTVGLHPKVTASGSSDIRGYSYLVELEDAGHTQKRIKSDLNMQIGSKMLDRSTGLYGEILAKDAIMTRRTT